MSTVAPTSHAQPLAGVVAAAPRVLVAGAPVTTEIEPSAQPSPPTPASALEAAVHAAAVRQDGLAPLLADLAAALKSPALPPGLRAAIQTLVSLQVPTDPPPTARDLRQAVAQSGLFLEARLASQATPTPADFKQALASLAVALAAQAGGESVAGHAELAPPPPYPDGPQRGQPAVASSLSPQAELAAVVGHLQRRVVAAQSRQLLQQAASAAGRPETGPWLFELPLATPQGAAIAQFQIDADAPSAEPAAERTWRARFTLDLPGMGPVHVHLGLRGESLTLGLFAEDAGAAARLDQDRPSLAAALRAESLSPRIAIHAGVPQTASAPAGHFVDSAA